MPVTVEKKVVEKKSEKELLKVDIEFKGMKMIIPEDMDYDEAIDALRLQKKQQESTVNISEVVRAFPLDGAVQFQRALSEIYGWASLVPTPGFWGDEPPTMISVEVGYNKTIQVPWGLCKVPRIDGKLGTAWDNEDNLPVFNLVGTVRRKDERAVTRIAARMRELVEESSIYKGSAIKIKFRDADGDRLDFSPSLAPKFIDLKAKVDQPIFSRDVEIQLRTNLFNPILHTDRCVKHGIPLKRGILLEGTFGTGKTLTATLLSRMCVENGWTFIYLENVVDLDVAIGLAKMYEPAVLFAEDVDRTTKGDRDQHMDRILNMIDGVDSKNHRIMVVLTTNELNFINPAFVRPGRIDAVIPLKTPDAEAMVRIARSYSKDTNGEDMINGSDADLQEAYQPLVGANAAFVRAAVDASKLSAVANCDDDKLIITPNDISAAITSMMPHVKLLNPNHGIHGIDVTTNGPVLGMDSSNVLATAGSLVVEEIATTLLTKLVNPKTVASAIKQGAKNLKRQQLAAKSDL